jgi:hypothetical protein
MYIPGSKLDHGLAHHFTDSNEALDSVLLLAEHNETLLTCGETTHYVMAHKDNYNLKLKTEVKGTSQFFWKN